MARNNRERSPRCEIGQHTAAPRYRCEYMTGLGYVVFGPDGALVPGSQTRCKMQAERHRAELQRADDRAKKRGPRPCMCCERLFSSDGIHNRLCDDCRRRSEGMV